MTDNEDFDVFDGIGIVDQATMIVNVRLKNGDTTTWEWFIASNSHPKGIAQKNRLSRENLKKSAEQEQQRMNGKKVKVAVERAEDIDRNNVEFIVERLIGWNPHYDNGMEVKQAGQPFTFSEENARKMLIAPASDALRRQAVDFIFDDNSFIPRSAKI